ncbi:suppressor of fused domain protein [Dactylosporangium sp. NPDC050588]|uniref:suppressor of fused domain protein n=1 Tax=Dactylosporangium sp. NPDC050588 TaxID=3157211 RepID=UPI0033C2F3B0
MTSDAPGWDAIDAALDRLYPGIEPKHYATLLKWSLGGPDPLDGISFYARDTPVPHWHIVSYGMSELYSAPNPDAEWSGWGYEFTFRVRRAPGETEPPVWAANFLQNLARYNFSSGNGFAPNHQMDLNGPIALEYQTRIRAISFVEDPELGVIDTPFGRVRFLQVFGLTLGEYAATQTWSTEAVLKLAAGYAPLFITDLGRTSFTDIPAFAEKVAAGRRRDGSSTSSLAVAEFAWLPDGDGYRLIVGAHAVERIAAILRGRLRFGRTLVVDGPDSSVEFSSGSFGLGTNSDGTLLRIVLTEEALDNLTGVLVPLAGASPVPEAPGLIVDVRPTLIRDSDGNVVERIG